MLNAKDYIIHRLTGNFVTDYSDASSTNLFNLDKKDWDERIITALGIPRAILPDPHPSSDKAGTISVRVAAETGASSWISLASRTPV